MNKIKPTHLIYFAVFYNLAIILVAHLLAPPEYLWTHNTISELAAQQVPYQWLMQTGLIGFGTLLISGLGWRAIEQKQISLADIGVMGWGLSMFFSGIFSAAPYLEGVVGSVREAQLHTLFANLAGISLSTGVFLHILRSPKESKWIHFVFLLLIMGISGMFGLAENGIIPVGDGIIQRLLWLIGFTWLFWAYRAKT